MSLAGVVVAGDNGGTRDRRRLARAPFTPSAPGSSMIKSHPALESVLGGFWGTATADARAS